MIKKPVHQWDIIVSAARDGLHIGFVEHRINGGRQVEVEAYLAGVYGCEADAFDAALVLLRRCQAGERRDEQS